MFRSISCPFRPQFSFISDIFQFQFRRRRSLVDFAQVSFNRAKVKIQFFKNTHQKIWMELMKRIGPHHCNQPRYFKQQLTDTPQHFCLKNTHNNAKKAFITLPHVRKLLHFWYTPHLLMLDNFQLTANEWKNETWALIVCKKEAFKTKWTILNSFILSEFCQFVYF